MNPTECQRLRLDWNNRQDAIAESWRLAIPRMGLTPYSAAEERQRFRDLTHQAIACLATEPFDNEAAQAIGTELARLRLSQPETLAQAQATLARLLLEGLTPQQVADLMPGLEALLAALATGFCQQMRTTILSEQEGIRAALVKVNAGLVADLKRELAERERIEQELKIARDNLELRVQERTGQLALANTALQADITQRKHAENELYIRNQMLEALLNAPTDLALLLDLDGRVEFVNETLATRLDVTPQDMIGNRVWDFFTPEAAEFRKNVMEKAVQTRQAQRVEDSTIMGPFDSLIYPILDDQGAVIEVAILARDISERMRTEQALSESEEYNRTLVESSPDGIVTTDLQGHILTANQRFLQLFKASNLAEIQSRAANPLELLVEKDRPDAAKAILDAPNNEITVDVEFRARCLDGSILPIAVNRATILEADGKPGGFIVTVRDISAREAAEDALRKNEALLRTIVENAPVVLGVIDPGGVITMVQGQMQMIAGLNLPELTGHSALELASRDAAVLRDIQRALSGEHIASTVDISNGLSFDTRYAPVFDDTGRVSSVIVVGVDVTERRQAQRQLQQAHDDLEQRVQERTIELVKTNLELRNEIDLRTQAEAKQRRSAERAEALARLAGRINAQLDLRAVLQAICDETNQMIDYPLISVRLYDEESGEFSIAASTAPDNPINYPVSIKSYQSQINQSSQAIIIPDVHSLSGASKHPALSERDVHTAIILPLHFAGELVGILNVASLGKVRLPSEDDLILLQGLAEQAAIAIANARLFEQVSESRQRLRALMERLVEAQESEQRRLARELHDEFGQALTALSLDLELLSRTQQSMAIHPPEVLDRLDNVRNQVNLLLRQVRETSLDLRPALLDDLGLLPALLSYIERYTTLNHIQVEFKHTGTDRRYPKPVEIAAFRAVQEALTNVARHAGVQRVTVRLWSNPQILGAQVQDQGTGFNVPAAFQSPHSSGLSGMNERVLACGGRLEIESKPGEGTWVTAEFPLSAEAEQE